MDSTDELVNEALAASQADGSDNRPNIYYDEDAERWIYRASSLGSCLRSLIQHRLGWPAKDAPASMKLKWAEGNRFEGEIIRRFCEEYGFRRLDNATLYEQYGSYNADRGQIETELAVGQIAAVRCHPDEVVESFRTTDDIRRRGIEVGDRYVLEVKKFAPSTYDKWKKEGWAGFPYYEWQMAMEMVSTGLPGVFCVGVMETEEDRPTEVTSELELVDVADWEPGIKFIDALFLPEPPRSRLDIIKRVMQVERAAEAHEAGEGLPEYCEFAMYPCGFFPCPGTAEGGEKREAGFRGEVEVTDHNELTADNNPVLYWTYKVATAQVMKKKYEDEIKEAKAELDTALGDDKTQADWWGVGRYEVRVDGRVGSWEPDMDKLTAAGKNRDYYDGLETQLRAWQKRGKGSTWVTVKERKKDKGENDAN